MDRYDIVAGIIVGGIVLSLIGFVVVFPYLESKDVEKECITELGNELGKDICWSEDRLKCYRDCESLGLEYIHFEWKERFTNPSCWCRSGNETKQIY